MNRGLQGKEFLFTKTGEEVRSFIPFPLPPDPPLEWSPPLRRKFDQALLALGRLDVVSSLLPDDSVFLYMYIRKEAVLSSMIEGSQSSFSDLLLYEMDSSSRESLDDTQVVLNYVAALERGLSLLKEGLPLSLRLLKEVHRKLLSSGRGSQQTPGEFRRSQNWIGGRRPGTAVFVPPPQHEVEPCMGQLEKFLHKSPYSPLITAALVHLQFEIIHPFLDGNGRLGRLLITLFLCEKKVLKEPLLYLSYYFKKYRSRYYELLNYVRLTGDWESWLEFFAQAVEATAAQAVETARNLSALFKEDQEKIRSLGRSSPSALQIHQLMGEHVIVTSRSLVRKTGLSPATVNKALGNLTACGIAEEMTQQKRNRIYRYQAYLDILNLGTGLPEN